jgi:hypothetical protein
LYSVMYTVYSVLLSPLWLKSVPGWPAISVGTFQQSRVGQIVWFGSLSAISQQASRGGGMGSWATLCLHSVTQPYTTCPRWREQGGGLRSLPLVVGDNKYVDLRQIILCPRHSLTVSLHKPLVPKILFRHTWFDPSILRHTGFDSSILRHTGFDPSIFRNSGI